MKTIKEIIKELVPDREQLVDVKEIISYCKNKKIPLALRTLVKYISIGLIKKPIYIGNKSYYEKSYIFQHIEAIYVLKILGKSLKEIKELEQKRGKKSFSNFVEEMYSNRIMSYRSR